MLYIRCPYCNESRDECEFVYGGEAFIERPGNQGQVSDAEWGNYLFCRKNPKGDHFEQWQHAHGCRKLFVVRRNTVTNEIAATGTLSALRNKWIDAGKKEAAHQQAVKKAAARAHAQRRSAANKRKLAKKLEEEAGVTSATSAGTSFGTSAVASTDEQSTENPHGTTATHSLPPSTHSNQKSN